MSSDNKLVSELRFQLTRTTVRTMLVLALVLSSAAVGLGLMEVAQQDETISTLRALDAAERSAAWQGHADWGDIAYYGFHYTYDSPSRLAFAALGQRDLLPWQHRVRMLALEGQIHERDVANPELASMGNFDFALVLSFLLPLLVIVLLHDLRAGERSAGRYALLVASAGDDRLWLRRALVLALALGFCMLLPFWAGALVSGTAVPQLLLATLAVVLYLAFWTWVVFVFARQDVSAEVTACRLVGVWFLLAIALPLGGRFAIIAALPLPESGEILMQQREVVNAAWDKPKEDTMTRFVATHPQWQANAKIELPFEWKWYYAFQQVGDQEVAELSQAYRAGIEARERAAWWLGLVSPPILLHKTLSCLARTDLAAALHYEDAVRAFHAEMRHFYYPLLFDGGEFRPELLEGHPVFRKGESTCAA
jgi:ABC-2 type transport system permease protein